MFYMLSIVLGIHTSVNKTEILGLMEFTFYRVRDSTQTGK